ncbi:hypothetical protein BS47DRAFT_865722 [Hydnum rufescens UP504]|uniref:Uncharacterized protein n=1 Tax=Hydnum rufescens UP504 TaxID=1448309 RepID=A0A9P6DXH2_9AGAM|nr:hypothetical protein BS47DRAFT_865722 [Hydnum rufescens UP504]
MIGIAIEPRRNESQAGPLSETSWNQGLSAPGAHNLLDRDVPLLNFNPKIVQKEPGKGSEIPASGHHPNFTRAKSQSVCFLEYTFYPRRATLCHPQHSARILMTDIRLHLAHVNNRNKPVMEPGSPRGTVLYPFVAIASLAQSFHIDTDQTKLQQ